MSHGKSALNSASFILYLLALLASSVYAYLKPAFNRDMIFYMGDAYVLSGVPPCEAQSRVLQDLRSIPEDARRQLSEGSELNLLTFHDCDSFTQQLRFYKIRLLYLGLTNGLRVFGLSAMHALRMVSALSFLAFGLLLFAWTRSYLSIPAASLLCLPVFLSFVPVARGDTADLLATVLVLWGLFLGVERGRIPVGLSVLVLCIFVRTEVVLIVLVMLAYFFVRKTLSLSWCVGLASLSVIIVLLLNWATGNYGWAMEFKETFYGSDPFPAAIHPRITVTMYLTTVLRKFKDVLETLMPFAIMMAMAVWFARRYRLLLYFVLAATAVKFVLYPIAALRHYLIPIAVAFVALVAELRFLAPAARTGSSLEQ